MNAIETGDPVVARLIADMDEVLAELRAGRDRLRALEPTDDEVGAITTEVDEHMVWGDLLLARVHRTSVDGALAWVRAQLARLGEATPAGSDAP